MNQRQKTLSAFFAGLVVAGLAFIIMPSSGLQGTVKAPNLDPIDFGTSECTITNCEIMKNLLEALGKTNSGVNTMTAFTHSFTSFTQDFHTFTEIILDEMGLVEKYEEAQRQKQEERKEEPKRR
jgi:hypothetical protein